MLTVHSVGRADARVVLWRQVKVLETLQRTKNDLKWREHKHSYGIFHLIFSIV